MRFSSSNRAKAIGFVVAATLAAGVVVAVLRWPQPTTMKAADTAQQAAASVATPASGSASASTGAAKPAKAAKKNARGTKAANGNIRNYPQWLSGAAGEGIPNPFGTKRGEPVTVIGSWHDTSAASQTAADVAKTHGSWNGALVLSVGGLVEGETWTKAAAGAYDARWKKAAANLAHRKGKPTFVSIAHEMNGNWMIWTVRQNNVAAFKKAWQRYVGIIRKALPDAYIVFSVNNGTHTNVTVDEMWPGDAYVDVLGVSLYGAADFPGNNEGDWYRNYDARYQGNPMGIGEWQKFAQIHNRPLGFTEWGLRGDDNRTENPVYIKMMNKFMHENAYRGGPAAGKVIFDVYFNVNLEGKHPGWMITRGVNPRSERMYRCLTWGAKYKYAANC